jgi:hypothetical protein
MSDSPFGLRSSKMGNTLIPVANIPFYRMGEPLIIPVSPTSAATPVSVTIPRNATAFRIVNPNPFSVRLCGSTDADNFIQVTPITGWLWLPCVEAVYSTLMPVLMSAMSVDGPMAAFDARQKAGIGVLEMQYGAGF